MKIPPGMTEAEVLEIIDKVSTRFAYKFQFGFYDYEDIKQEASILAIEGLENYKPIFPLENFLCVHVRNRLCNFKRNNFERIDKPCAHCPINAYNKAHDTCRAFDNKMDCELYAAWRNRNDAKKNIISPVNMENVLDDDGGIYTTNALGDILDQKEMIEKIDAALPVYMRHIWLKARGGIKITAEEMRQLKEAVLEIFNE